MWVTEAGHERVEGPAVPVLRVDQGSRKGCCGVCVCVCSREGIDFDFGEEETCVEDLICEAVNMTITICLQRN